MTKPLQLTVLLAVVLSCATTAGAAQGKFVYLKVGEGESAHAYAFKSKQACETARRQHTTSWNRMISQLKKQTGNRGTFAPAPRAKCLDSLPLGFVRPKSAN